jgi:hypothetical protein
MFGQISAYDSGTGSMTVLVTATGLLGTYANWTISLAPAVVSTTVVQTDIGTDPNQIPLNQFLGTMAYQDLPNVELSLRPIVPLTSPTVQDVIDALLALGLVIQED